MQIERNFERVADRRAIQASTRVLVGSNVRGEEVSEVFSSGFW